MDLLVEDSVIVEIKAVDELCGIHKAQLLTYLKAADKRVGLLINFNVSILKNGLKRIVNRYTGAPLERSNTASSVDEPEERAKAESLISSPRLSPHLRFSAVNPLPAPHKDLS
jgi:hypothetical protein